MKGSPTLEEKENSSRCSTLDRNSKDRSNSFKSESGKTRVFKVREDVYLVHNNVVDKNLLKSSISTKLRQSIPGELCNRTEVVNKLRRENLKEYLRLSSLNKKFSSEMQMEKNRISNEGHQLIKRQEQMRRNSDLVRRNQEKMKMVFENRKTPSSTLPQISHRSTTPVAKRVIVDHTNGETAFVKRNDRPATYPRVPIDKDDPTFIKVFKHNGVFLPQNRYPDKHSIAKPENSILKRGQMPITPDYEDLTLSMNDLDLDSNQSSPALSPKEFSKQKSARRVTWSGVDREKTEKSAPKSAVFVRKTPELFSPVQDKRSDMNSTPCSQKSFKSDSALFKHQSYRKGRSKIETIGIQWKLPPGSKVESSRSRSAGHLSKNLNPCSAALDSEGISITKTKWHVPRMQSLESYELYKIWLEKLENLKTGKASGVPMGPRIHSSNRSISLTVPTMSEAPNASLITGSNM
ncbi:uncharacterized protein LOC133183665 [Saccostrea echinata]|uniref:uncharacterized protein LOC133183665 n=1 Tax=Saccostrea echinata TaxID=191078 RepID=UPI002A7F2F2E|nr:uncharacterized protein LOC133183665 [Saccostrea echinata]